jgi:hypothetical protein
VLSPSVVAAWLVRLLRKCYKSARRCYDVVTPEGVTMNAERLHVVAIALRNEFQRLETVDHLQQMREALERLTQNPQQPQFQQQVSSRLNELQKRLSTAPSNSFSPAWRQIVEELGASAFVGNALAERLTNIFERNQITYPLAAAEVKQAHEEAARIKTALDQISSAFQTLHIPAEDLQPGECELGVLIPRSAVENSLVPFAKELGEINFIVLTFSELTTGATDSVQIRTISSSDLTVYLDVGLKVGAAIGQAVAWIIDRYKSILEIRKQHAELQKQGVPAERLKGIEDYANDAMSIGIEQIVPQIVETYCTTADKTRKNELTNGIRISLNKIANRIDRGFNFEIRVEPIKRDAQGLSVIDNAEMQHIDTIQETSKTLEFMNLEPNPILRLPDSGLTRSQESQPTRNTTPRKKRGPASTVRKE